MFEHADDAIWKSLDGNRLIDRVFAQKKCLAQVVADYGNVGAMKILRLGEKASDIGARVKDLFVLDKHSRVIQAGNFLVLVTRGDGGQAIEVVHALEDADRHLGDRRAL